MSAVDMLNKVRIMAMLIGDRRVGAYDIDVEVHGGAVTLRGTVESEEQKRIAEDLTREVQIVNEIDNELAVEPETAQYVGSESGTAVIPGPGTLGPTAGAIGATATFLGGAEPPPVVVPAGEGVAETAVITESIEKKIAEDGRITSKNINVTVEDGVAHLTGIVDSVEEYYLVQETAESVEGVNSVKNDLEIEEGHTGHKCNCGRM
jgi:osmotically-inducible protein OsmY